MSEPTADKPTILDEAKQIVYIDKRDECGGIVPGMRVTAALWNAYLKGLSGRDIGPHDVATMMILLKVSRAVFSPSKRDHWVDIAGYAAVAAECTSDAMIEAAGLKISEERRITCGDCIFVLCRGK